MFVAAYLETVRSKFATGDATEHSYRSALEGLFENAAADLAALNEPKRVACGAPDFIIQRKGIPVGHCEAKDLHINLASLKDDNLAQKKRYLKALPNLVYTNGLDFEFYKSGEIVRKISIGMLAGGKIKALPEHFATLANQLAAFAAEKPQSITSAKKLAEMMAGKAVLIKDIMGKALKEDAALTTELTGQYQAFKAHLIHDIGPDDFADIYAETIAYGMFAARLHDPTPDTFSRAEALELLPKSNPFLRSLFGYIAGVDLDDRIRWVIDELADVFQACDLNEIMKDFGKFTARNDPFLHFYETFLAEYNPAKRKARGVWYTPEPVVNFIVRAVDDVLKTEFGLPLGLADTSKITIDWETGQTDAKGKRQTLKKQVHRVQILDPATGTGTFLAEVIKQIAATVKGMAEGMWSGYVEQDLIPRLHGFELLMASYAMCHMKLDMMLTELGYKPTATPPRLGVYLTNSLEEGEAVTQNLFAQWLANEAKSASEIKRQMPIMCVIGNPPYSGESANKGDWIMRLMEAYKKEPGGKVRLEEKNSKWINDDYVKFIRFAEHMIAKNGEGILGFITNHGYLDNPTFRGMRWHLLDTFDKIYVLDLHGNAKKKEVSPDGTADKNVFDIMQGVAILIGVKRAGKAGRDKPLAEVFHGELWGGREGKNDALWGLHLSTLSWSHIHHDASNFVFFPKRTLLATQYKQGFSIADFMPMNQIGFQSHRDGFAVAFDKIEIEQRFRNMLNEQISDEAFLERYQLADANGWSVFKQRVRVKDVIAVAVKTKKISKIYDRIVPCDYRPFDRRFCMLDEAMMDRPRWPLMKNIIPADSFALNFVRQTKANSWQHGIVSKFPAPAVYVEIKDGSNCAPFYTYESIDGSRRVNFDPKIYAAILAKAALPGADGDELKVFDYIYGVLHSPDYRRTYAQFLKIDFPRVPYPASSESFAHLAQKGGQLRRLHLIEDAAIGATPYPFKGEGAGAVAKPVFTDEGKVFINPHQWFEGVPRLAWEFHIGGYQPAQKWLKDRKGRTLSFDDVRHYQKIIKILSETDRIMKEIELEL